MARIGDSSSRGGHAPIIAVEPSCPPSPPSVLPPPPPSPLASFAAEMFVWLWFAPIHARPTEKQESRSEMEAGLRMQFAPSQRFTLFCHDVLTTTQVSHSVVLLALLFVSRLKHKNSIKGSPGSEFRLAVTGLMLANKVLDDNTYTARTWSQVSSLELKPLVEGEAEFLKGLNWSLHVTEREFKSFLKLLEGHVAARNSRVGGTGRKIASTSRVRRAQVEKYDLGLGISALTDHLPPSVGHGMVDGGRNVRRRIGETTMSANSTPTMGFGTFSRPFVNPISAPHLPPQPMSAQPSYYNQAPEPRSAHPVLESSPTSTPSDKLGTKKRNLDAMSRIAPYPPSLPHFLLPTSMSRSQSSSASFSSTTPAFTHPPSSIPHPLSSPSPLSTPTHSHSHANHLPFPRPPQLDHLEQIHDSFQTLSNSFSPRYDPTRPLHQRLSSLDYYSLAAGQGQGHLHQMRPFHLPSYPLPPPSALAQTTHLPPPHIPSSAPPTGPPAPLSLSPFSSSRTTNYQPTKPSVLSGLRSSPPSSETLSRRSSHQHSSASYSQPPSRRSSKVVASSPGTGYHGLEDGTSTPRPSTSGSTSSNLNLGEEYQSTRFGPVSAGFHHPSTTMNPAHWQHPGLHPHLGALPAPPHFAGAPGVGGVGASWSSYSNAGPPGVYWAAYPPLQR
ncbi:hypothetical protein JCM16303_006748 [Sporobolomyces ruberrimus]